MHNILKMTGLGEDSTWEIVGSTQSLDQVLLDSTLIQQQAGQINLHYTCHHVEPSSHREFSRGEWLFFDFDKIKDFNPESTPLEYQKILSQILNIDPKYIWTVNSGRGVHLLVKIKEYSLDYLSVHKSTYAKISKELENTFPDTEIDPVFHMSKSLRLPNTLNRKEGKEDVYCLLVQKGEPYGGDLLTEYRLSYDSAFDLAKELEKMAVVRTNSQQSHALPAIVQSAGVNVNGIATPEEIKQKCSFVSKLEDDLAFLPREAWLRGVGLLTSLGMEREAHEWSSKSASYKFSETENIIESAKQKGLFPTSCDKIATSFDAELTKGCATCPYKACKSPAKLHNDPTLLAMSHGFYEMFTNEKGEVKRGKLNFKELGNFCQKYLHVFSVWEHNQVYAWNFQEEIYEKQSRESMANLFNNLIQPTPIDPTQTKLKGYDTMAISHAVKEKNVLPPDGFVPLQNGWLNVLSGDLEPYSPKWLVTQKIPVAYDPIAACPRFEKFLQERVGDPKTIEVLLEYICYALCGIRYPNRKILVLEGPKGTGKSTLITVLQKLFGHLSTMSQLQHLTGRFETSVFENKRLVLFDEAPTAKDQNLIELLKNLSGSEYIKIERKNENAMTVQNLARLVIACNEIPRGGAIDTGFMDRLLIVPMHNQIEQYNMVEANAMVNEELSGILNLILKRFSRLKAQNFNIEQTEVTQEQANNYQQENDPIAAFILESIDFVKNIVDTDQAVKDNSKRGSQETVISLKNFRKEFQVWAKDENPYYANMSSTQIKKHLGVLIKTMYKKRGLSIKTVSGVYYILGMRFKDSAKLEAQARDLSNY